VRGRSTPVHEVSALRKFAEANPGSRFSFCGYGETLTNSQVPEMVGAVMDFGHCTIITNGTLLNSDAFQKVFGRQIRDVNFVVSFHPTQIPNVSDWVRNVNDFAMKLEWHDVDVMCVANDSNLPGIEMFYDEIASLETELAINSITFKQQLPGYDSIPCSDSTIERIVELFGLKSWRNEVDESRLSLAMNACPNGYRTCEITPEWKIVDCAGNELGSVYDPDNVKWAPGPHKCDRDCRRCDICLNGLSTVIRLEEK
jgi:hypothetical protein